MSIEDDKDIVYNLLLIFNNILNNSKEVKTTVNLSIILMSLSMKYNNEIRIIEVLLKIIVSISHDSNLINELVESGKFKLLIKLIY